MRRHGWRVWEPRAAVRYISSVLEELASLKIPSKVQQPRTADVLKPQEGWVKVNTDTTFHSGACTGAVVWY